MKTKTLIFFLFGIFILSSCVSKSEHQKVVRERNQLLQENKSLKSELKELKFGIPNLMADGKTFFQAEEFKKAKEKFQTLLTKHPNAPETIEAKEYLKKVNEEILWHNAITSEDIIYVNEYISKYPEGKYISRARPRKVKLKKLNKQKAYQNAVDRNKSYVWEDFLEKYPNYKDAASISKKIIQLKVNEILGNANTGRMPSFQSHGTRHSSSSKVSITNSTGCPLTVRYSGPDVKAITIPENETRTVYLSSGEYKIAASACGENYGATESLHGKYSSEFYIRTVRY